MYPSIDTKTVCYMRKKSLCLFSSEADDVGRRAWETGSCPCSTKDAEMFSRGKSGSVQVDPIQLSLWIAIQVSLNLWNRQRSAESETCRLWETLKTFYVREKLQQSADLLFAIVTRQHKYCATTSCSQKIIFKCAPAREFIEQRIMMDIGLKSLLSIFT